MSLSSYLSSHFASCILAISFMGRSRAWALCKESRYSAHCYGICGWHCISSLDVYLLWNRKRLPVTTNSKILPQCENIRYNWNSQKQFGRSCLRKPTVCFHNCKTETLRKPWQFFIYTVVTNWSQIKYTSSEWPIL